MIEMYAVMKTAKSQDAENNAQPRIETALLLLISIALPREVRECAVRFGHAVHIQLLLDRVAFIL